MEIIAVFFEIHDNIISKLYEQNIEFPNVKHCNT